jgi:hypothetical protein
LIYEAGVTAAELRLYGSLCGIPSADRLTAPDALPLRRAGAVATVPFEGELVEGHSAPAVPPDLPLYVPVVLRQSMLCEPHLRPF